MVAAFVASKMMIDCTAYMAECSISLSVRFSVLVISAGRTDRDVHGIIGINSRRYEAFQIIEKAIGTGCFHPTNLLVFIPCSRHERVKSANRESG